MIRGTGNRADLDKKPDDVASMFDEVAERYDVTNDVLSLGQTVRWRRKLVEALAVEPGEYVLDLAAGTGSSTVPFHRAGAVAAEMEREYLSTFVGETVEVLFEENKNGRWRGYTTRYTEVVADSDANLHNQFRLVRITAAEGGKLVGELV